ncbi:MAG: DUF2851 family protein [Saprospiraceae bacterium]|nr:DUF2851 family protein [Saprospiraceae bacterium]
MREDFLHYLWRTKRLDARDLHTTEGESLEILHFGTYNPHSGPDFTNARLRIGDTIWAGNVEMHLCSSEWLAHGHQTDKAYDNVILHVVLEEDQVIARASGERIPCLEVKSLVPPKLSSTYLKLLHNEYWIPCQYHFFQVKEMTKNLWLERLLVERIEEKTNIISETLKCNNNNWEETFYQMLARNFGMKVNAEPFELLAKSTPLLTLLKHKNSLNQLEALLFGQSGLLESGFENDYPNQLKKEYNFLQKKYNLTPILGESWKFMRLRPASFPTIRVAQFATLIFQSNHLFSKMLAAKDIAELENMFELKLSNYWLTHYIFDKESKKTQKKLGKSAIHLLIINTIVPFLFLYGKLRSEDHYQDKALQLLEQLPPENNHIIENWHKLGVTAISASQTQALLQLKNQYCDSKRCLDCAIGNAILQA